jgi:acetyltransferase-like isoleucine patch superfamily enzyme
VPRNSWDIVIGDGVALDDQVVLLTTGSRGTRPRLVIGNRTYVNRFTMFDASEDIEVGQNSRIGPFCYLTDHDHGTARIGNNVWIGAGVTVLKGDRGQRRDRRGRRVTRDVAPGATFAGVPARQTKAGSQQLVS